MLTPQQVQGIADDLSIIYSRVESECVASIAKHIASGKRITEASLWQMKKLNDVGALKKDLLWRIKKESGVALPQIRKVVESAMERSLNTDIRFARHSLSESSGMDKAELYESIKKSAEFQRILKNAVAGCKDAMNLTATKALQSSIASYTKAINTAYLKMTSGNYSYADAVREAVQDIGKSGIRIVDGKKSIRANELVKKNGTTFTTYKNGDRIRLYPLDSAIRRDLTTQINRACGELTINDAGEVGTDLVVTSWHMGARPEHERWQGKVFSLKPNHPKYPYFYDSQEKGGTGYGDILGLCGINCYHSFNPYFDGDEINNDDQPTKEENDRAYAEQQQQRTYERSLRSLKRQQIALYEGGFKENAGYIRSQVIELNGKYNEFLTQTGRSRISMMDSVGGYHAIKSYTADDLKYLDIESIGVRSGNEYAIRKFYADNRKRIDDGGVNAIVSYTGKSFKNMNEMLRYPDSYDSSKMEVPLTADEVKKLNSTLRKTLNETTIDENIKAYKGYGSLETLSKMIDVDASLLKDNEYCELIEGIIIRDNGFCSTSIFESKALKREVMIEVLIPKGTHGMYIQPLSKYPKQYELLLQSRTGLKIRKAEYKNGILHLVAVALN